jgi:signal transduction histidine kinase
LILLIGLLATTALTTYAHRAADAERRRRFERTADGVSHALESRIEAYIALLRGAAGLFAASERVRLPEFRAYVARLELSSRYPGIQGVGFSRIVRDSEREAIAADAEADGLAVRFWPEQPERDVHAIVYLEPLDSMNRVALGFDMSTEPVRREAMARARDTGAPAASGRVRLVQEQAEPGREQAGFLIYVPVYGGPIPSVEERAAQLKGYVFSPFRATDLLTNIGLDRTDDGVLLEVYDGLPPATVSLLYRTDAPATSSSIEARRSLSIAGRPWTVVLHSVESGRTSLSDAVVILAATGGTILSVLLFTLARNEIRGRDEAERIAHELRDSEEALRHANRAKDEFLAVVSHELRTPLNAILGWIALLQKGMLPPAKQVHALEVIERNAAIQANLIEDLLDTSRAVTGSLRLQLMEMDVAAALRVVAESARPSADAQGVRLTCDLADDLGTIRADPARMQQVISNLIGNALKFTPAGGIVHLRASRERHVITIEVSDNGIGIDPDFLPHVFDRFRQAETFTTRARSGVGLGLTIARHLVSMHRGTIVAKSDGPGHGSTFIITLPVNLERLLETEPV